MTHLIVDGYNVIHAQQNMHKLTEDKAREARKKLIYYLNNYLQTKNCKITVVFDAHRYVCEDYINQKMNFGKINVIFALPGETADHLIKKIVKRESSTSSIIVATSDKGIIDFVKKFNVRVISSHAFYNKIRKDDEKLSPSEYFERYVKGYIEEEPKQSTKYQKGKGRN